MLEGCANSFMQLVVLVEQAAEQVASLPSAAVILARDGQPSGLIWRLQH
jgi:hypothetical protein